MDNRRRPRIAIAVEPAILADALAEVLRYADVDDIVDLRDHPHVDAALVTIGLPNDVDAEVVIELPNADCGTGPAGVHVHGQSAAVRVDGLADVLRLLDDYCPGRNPRT
ncbi:MAG TPA: hypothetical protein VM938_12785 [Acidimicrobiales bacterium]|nr:hypothetical protein [Acidimicrobiales bacterium]